MKTNPIIYLFAILALLVISALALPGRVTLSKLPSHESVASNHNGVRRARVLSHSSGDEGETAQTDSNPAPTVADQIAELVLPGKKVDSANATSSTYSFISTQDALPAQWPSKDAQVIPIVGPVSLDQDLRTLPHIPQEPEGKNEERVRRRRHPPAKGPVGISDPLRPIRIPSLPSAMPTPLQSFAGLTSAQCGNCFPPDTDGDVGPNHYIQAVNVSFKIMDKAGTELLAPTTYNSLFSALGSTTPCGYKNRGDAIVFYDHMADRWVISDFAWPAFPGVSFYQCIGVSKTADPVAGGWWLYALQVDPANPTFMGDYPKFGVWPDAYYMSVDMFSDGTTFNGVRVYALPRDAMINGTGAPNPGAIAFSITPATLGDAYGLLPATFRSGLQPSAGGTVTPEYFMSINSSSTAGTVENQVFTWRFHADFTTPANSTFGVGVNHTPDGTITVDNFVDAITSSGPRIVPQTGTTTLLDALGDRLMYPLVYQNLGGVESIHATHTINNNQSGTGPAAIRWYQFNVTGSTIPATPTQQQTFNNGGDGLWRFMPSLNVDGLGNLAIGYSESSNSTNPAIAYAGRLVADTPNTLAQGEAILIQGAGHQTGFGRWGDYSSTFIDPSDDCTFWHTGEYYSVTSAFDWSTRIGTFKFPGCSQSAAVTVPVALPNVAGAAIGSSVSIPITVSDLTGLGVRAYDLQVSFDPAVLQPLATPYDSLGTLSSGMFITPNGINPGHLIISAFQATELIGSGTLLKLRFSVVGAAGQSTTLAFQDYTDPNAGFHPAFRFNAGNPQAITTNGSLTVNTTPTISSSPVTRQAGSPTFNSIVATVNDTESGAGGVTVTVNGSASATVNGVTVSNIVNTNGTVTADVIAVCTATNATFTLTATDGVGATTPATLNVTVSANTAPTLVYSTPQSMMFGGSLNVTPTAATDNGSITGYSLQSVVPTLTTAPTVNGSGVVSVTNAQPSGSHVITIRATDNCGLITDTQITLNVGALPSFAINDVSVSEGNTGTTSLAFTVTKTGNTALNATVDYVTVDGTATSPSDFTAITTTTLTFLPADISKTITVLINGDTVFEPNESFNVNLSSGTNATIADNQGVGTISNDDAQPTISINDVSVTEGNTGTSVAGFTVSLSNPSSQTVTVNYATANNTATAGSDYVATSGTLTFTAGQTSQPISVTINGDTMFEPNESFNVNLSSATNATIADNQGVGTVTNDDAALISGRVAYGDTVTPVKDVTMTLTAPSFTTQTTTTDVNGNYTFVGVPVGNDYTVTPSKTGDVNGLESLDASDTARYVAGLAVPSGNQRIAADADGDGILTSFDASLIARYVVGLPDAGIVGTWKFNPGTLVFPAFGGDQTSQNFAAILVGDAGGNWTSSLPSGDRPSSSVRFDVNRSPFSATSPAVTVPVALPNVAGAAIGSSVSIPITVSDLTGLGVRAYDLQVSFDPAVLQPLATPYDSSGTLSSGMFITPNGINPGHLIISAFQATELIGSGTLLKLRFSVVGAAGQSTTLAFQDYTDPNAGFHPAFRFNAGNPQASTTNGSLSVNTTPTIQFDSATYSVGEGDGSVSVNLTRQGDTTASANVSFNTGDSAGIQNCDVFNGIASLRCDYITSIGTLQFAPGEASKTVSILIVDDSYAEGNETFTVNLSNGSGSSLGTQSTATVTIQDNDSVTGSNPNDVPNSFVRQHYLDFLSRQPDTSGLAFWTNEITSCGTNQQCIEIKRISVSAAFYLSIEFQDTGYLVERFYKVAYGDANGTSTFGGTHQFSVPTIRLNEFLPDSQEIGRGVVVNQGNWQQQLEDNKNAFAAVFVQRSRFTAAFPNSMTAAQFVDKLNQNAGIPLSQSERDQLVTDLSTNAKTRAQVLRAVAEDPDLVSSELNRAFVLMQYFGYLRRNPNDPQDSDYTGYDFWLTKLNQFNGDFVNAEMVKAFIASSEYRQRFGP